jgi:hypothetical protein
MIPDHARSCSEPMCQNVPHLKKKIEELVTAAGMSKSTAANALVTVHARIRADKAAIASVDTPVPAAISVSTGGQPIHVLGAAVHATFPKHFPIECPKCKNGGRSVPFLSPSEWQRRAPDR